MSRIGNKAITIPQGVEISIADGNEVTVKGPKGTLTRQFSPLMTIEAKDGTVTVKRPDEEKHTKQLHGTTRALLANMIQGVHQEYSKHLQIIGIGYRAAVTGSKLDLLVGYSHPVDFEIPKGLTVTCKTPTDIVITGIDKQLVGEVAAKIRGYRAPEPYKGKGVKYSDETIIRKEAKKA